MVERLPARLPRALGRRGRGLAGPDRPPAPVSRRSSWRPCPTRRSATADEPDGPATAGAAEDEPTSRRRRGTDGRRTPARPRPACRSPPTRSSATQAGHADLPRRQRRGRPGCAHHTEPAPPPPPFEPPPERPLFAPDPTDGQPARRPAVPVPAAGAPGRRRLLALGEHGHRRRHRQRRPAGVRRGRRGGGRPQPAGHEHAAPRRGSSRSACCVLVGCRDRVQPRPRSDAARDASRRARRATRRSDQSQLGAAHRRARSPG